MRNSDVRRLGCTSEKIFWFSGQGASPYFFRPCNPDRDSLSHMNRAGTIGIALNLSESTAGWHTGLLKSFHQRKQTAIHASVMAMFSDWLRLSIRIVKNAYARPKEMTFNAQ